jgi:hypothetical protein
MNVLYAVVLFHSIIHLIPLLCQFVHSAALFDMDIKLLGSCIVTVCVTPFDGDTAMVVILYVSSHSPQYTTDDMKLPYGGWTTGKDELVGQ